MTSLNVLLTTVGRETLNTRMLPSLVNQLNDNDYLTVVSDLNHDIVSHYISLFNFKCTVIHIRNNKTLGYWGHPSRSKYQNNLLGDFILHADDDDRYVDNAFDIIRQIVTDRNKLYLFRVDNEGVITWTNLGVVKIGEIGTPCGVIPNNKNLPDWGCFYGGDGDFYKKLSNAIPYQFVDYIIYKVNDTK